jgi:hypothetical protein
MYALLTFIEKALAAPPETVNAATNASNPIGSILGGDTFGEILVNIAGAFTPLVTIVAVVLIARAGFNLVVEQTEEQIGRSRRTIVGALVAIVLVNIAGPISDAIFGNTNIISSPSGMAANIGDEIRGLIRWFEVSVATAAVLMIVVSGLRAVASFGSEAGITELRRTVLGVAGGIILLTAKAAFTDAFITQKNPGPIITEIATIVGALMAFMALVAVVIIIYAGLLMIFNVGNDDQYQKAKGLLLRVLIGLLVIVSSGAIAGLVTFF